MRLSEPAFRRAALAGPLLLFLALLALQLSGLSPSAIADDHHFIRAFQAAPWSAMLGPFRYGGAWWRPIGTSSMLAPLWLSGALGLPGAILASKILSLAIFAGAAWAALARLGMSAAPSRARLACCMAAAAALLALAPTLCEPSMWLSARFDLLLCLWIALLMLRMDSPRTRPFAEALLLGCCLCLSKESGMAWAAGLGALFCLDPARRDWGRGLLGAAFCCFLAWKLATHFAAPGPHPSPLPWAPAGSPRWAAALEASGRQLLWMAIPPLDPNPLHPEGFPAWAMALGAALPALGLACLARLGARLRRGQGSPEAAWAAAACAMALAHAWAGAGQRYPGEGFSDWLVASRYLAPSALVLLACGAREAASGRGWRALACSGAIACALAFSALAGPPERAAWSSSEALWRAAWADGPRTALSAGYLAMELDDQGRRAEAARVAREWTLSDRSGAPACRLWSLLAALPERDLAAEARAKANLAAIGGPAACEPQR